MQPTDQENHQFMIRRQPLIQRKNEQTVHINDQLIAEAIHDLQHNELFLDERLAAALC